MWKRRKNKKDEELAGLLEMRANLEQEVGSLFVPVDRDGVLHACFKIIAGPYTSIVFGIPKMQFVERDTGLVCEFEHEIYEHNIDDHDRKSLSFEGFRDLAGKIATYMTLLHLTKGK